MLPLFKSVNTTLFTLFFLCYAYQLYFVLIRWLEPMRIQKTKKNHKYAVLIPARNESKVLSGLLDSIQAQDYPLELLDIYVIADNCTDNTADLAKEFGAQVIHRNNLEKIGKGTLCSMPFKPSTRRRVYNIMMDILFSMLTTNWIHNLSVR